MGFVFADITLSNAGDMELARRGYKKPEEIRGVIVSALVDSGAYGLALPEDLVVQLDPPHVEFREFGMADGSKVKLSVVGPVVVKFKNRQTVCCAVKTRDEDMLLGSIPMEDMDVVIHPRSETLEVNPESPYMPRMKLK